MNNLYVIIGAIVAVILTFLGMKGKINKLNNTVKEKEAEVKTQQKQTDIYKANQEATVEAVQVQDEKKEEQKAEEQEIEKAQNDSEVIAIANDIVDSFNKL